MTYYRKISYSIPIITSVFMYSQYQIYKKFNKNNNRVNDSTFFLDKY